MQQHLFDRHADRTARDSELMRGVELGLRIARRAMRSYSHDHSPKVFTQPRLLACLILKAYGARWDIETTHSAMKRRLGSDLTARTNRTLKHEAALRALTYAIIV